MKLEIAQTHKTPPMKRSGTDRNILTGAREGSCTGKRLSSHNETKTSSTPKLNQNMIPMGVRIVFSLLLVVAIR